MPETGYSVEPVDLDYYQRQISCQSACPVRTDARGYVNAVSERAHQAGYVRARQPNPFASTCGRVCAAHCEKACRRGKIDSPITIRALKRFLCETYGVEATGRLTLTDHDNQATGIALLTGDMPANSSTMESFGQLRRGRRQEPTLPGAAVAVIGSGPAGLTAAHDLALLGYRVSIFEAAPQPGGMAVLGVPQYRLPREVLKREMEEIQGLGVELKVGSRLGADFSLADLRREGFRAVFLAIGAHKNRQIDIDGVHLDGVIPAIDFLLNVNLGYRVNLGDKVVVLGGGNVALDAARLATRLGEVYELLAEGELVTALDAARNVRRLGVRDVRIVYRGSRDEMRASHEEIAGALEEGIDFRYGLAPKRIIGEHGKVTGLEVQGMQSIYDEKGRRRLVPLVGSESTLDCSSVILAIGQESDLSFIQPQDGIAISGQGNLVADPETLATSAPGIFAGGDVVYGPRTIIEAVADGHRAARGIHSYLTEGRSRVVRHGWMVPVSLADLPDLSYAHAPRANPPKVDLNRRTGISEVEQVYDEAAATVQAGRCLKCHIQTVFDSDLCIVCGGCVDICPNSCLKLVPVAALEGGGDLANLVQARYGAVPAGQRTAMIKDETRCIRCGLCFRRCPTRAITMEAFWFEERLVFEGEQA